MERITIYFCKSVCHWVVWDNKGKCKIIKSEFTGKIAYIYELLIQNLNPKVEDQIIFYWSKKTHFDPNLPGKLCVPVDSAAI